jgi:hypothetical protein
MYQEQARSVSNWEENGLRWYYPPETRSFAEVRSGASLSEEWNPVKKKFSMEPIDGGCPRPDSRKMAIYQNFPRTPVLL